MWCDNGEPMDEKNYSMWKFIWNDESEQMDLLEVKYEHGEAVKSFIYKNLTLLNYGSSSELDSHNTHVIYNPELEEKITLTYTGEK